MTLQEFFDLISDNPWCLFAFFVALPIGALITGILDNGKGYESPWKYIYSTLVYLACIPGIFAITLSIYVHLFEGRSIMNINLYTQVIPIISMIASLLIIKRNVPFEYIPGFDRITGLVFMIAVLIAVLWLMEKLHIFAVTFIPFHLFALLFVGMLFVLRIGWKKMAK